MCRSPRVWVVMAIVDLGEHARMRTRNDLAANEHPGAKPQQHATFSGPTEWSRWSGQTKGVSGCCEASPTWRHRLVRPQEGAHLVDRLLEQVLRLSPGKYRRLGLRRERGNVHGRLIGVRRRVVRHHEEWRLAGSDELPRHAVHEVRAYAIEVVQIGFDALRGDLRPSGPQLGAPDIAPRVVHDVGILRPMPDRLAQHGGHDAVGARSMSFSPNGPPMQ